MKVEEAMTREVRRCRPESSLAEVVNHLWEGDCGIVPVVDDEDHLVGVLTDRDICIALATRGQTASSLSAGDVMTRQVHTCAPEDDAKAALRAIGRQRVRRLPVTDEEGKLVGILSISDLIRCAKATAGRKTPAVSCQEVIDALKALGTRRVEAAETRREAAAAQMAAG